MWRKAVIFDLDGVIVSTDEYHYRAWKRMCEEEGLPFDRSINERLRGVSRMDSLSIILEQAVRPYSEEEMRVLAERKNEYYKELLAGLSPNDLLPGVQELLETLRQRGIRTAIGSSSKNTPHILKRIGLADAFEAVADGNGITRSKPDPEVFLLAARKLGLAPADCVVVEDAEAGLEAARSAGMKAVGVGSASESLLADVRAKDLSQLGLEQLLG
ncbi:beta-phosphoglucomutase [Gorillibacterium sp. sgz5001074]|uniref:beta-phosphoglucomutase n=1 Tax=Gorillibacterium sp. sgz5001074 TaxID=3446695 RepID=UPI003F67CB04